MGGEEGNKKSVILTVITISIRQGRDNELRIFLSADTCSDVTDLSDTSGQSSRKAPKDKEVKVNWTSFQHTKCGTGSIYPLVYLNWEKKCFSSVTQL